MSFVKTRYLQLIKEISEQSENKTFSTDLKEKKLESLNDILILIENQIF